MLRPGTIALAFFGDGATSQGMLMEAMNLAVVWKLPVLFVCKDNAMAITTPAKTAVGGNLLLRAQAFGMQAFEVDGADVLAVWTAAEQALHHARTGGGPVFLWAHCLHLEGHFLGDGLLDILRRPLYSLRKRILPILGGLFSIGGAPLRERLAALRQTTGLVSAARQQVLRERDPLWRARRSLEAEDPGRLAALEAETQREIQNRVASAQQPAHGGA